jgi:hypothetical protein
MAAQPKPTLPSIGLFIFSLSIVFCSCSNGRNKPTFNEIKLSKSQAFLNNLEDSLEFEYLATSSETSQMQILDKYHALLQSYLMTHAIDSIRVTVDEIKDSGWTITSRFHYNKIEFKYGLTFKENMPSRDDSLYKFVKGLKPKSDTNINFAYMGSCQVNSPNNKTLPVFRIFAFPFPLQFTGN